MFDNKIWSVTEIWFYGAQIASLYCIHGWNSVREGQVDLPWWRKNGGKLKEKEMFF